MIAVVLNTTVPPEFVVILARGVEPPTIPTNVVAAVDFRVKL